MGSAPVLLPDLPLLYLALPCAWLCSFCIPKHPTLGVVQTMCRLVVAFALIDALVAGPPVNTIIPDVDTIVLEDMSNFVDIQSAETTAQSTAWGFDPNPSPNNSNCQPVSIDTNLTSESALTLRPLSELYNDRNTRQCHQVCCLSYLHEIMFIV